MLPLWLFSLLWWTAISVVTASPCSDPSNVEYYHQYSTGECPPIFHIDGDDCQATDWYNPLNLNKNKEELRSPEHLRFLNGFDGYCDSFCQLRTTYHYRQEQPIDTQKLCRGPTTCTLTPIERIGIDWPSKHPNAPAGFHDQILDIAIDGGYASGSGDSWQLAKDITVSIGQGECGYWTFVPFMKTTCGTYTRRDTKYKGDTPFGFRFFDKCENTRSFGNVCAVQPLWNNAETAWNGERVDAARVLGGVYRFVDVDCFTGQKLASVLQDEHFRHPGVAIKDDSAYWKTLTQRWEDMTDLQNWKVNDVPACKWDKRRDTSAALASVPHPGDCIDALNELRKSADVVYSTHGPQFAASYGQCYVWVHIQSKAPLPSCQYTALEVAIAIEEGRRQCGLTFNQCPSWPLYDKGDGCFGWVTVTNGPRFDCW